MVGKQITLAVTAIHRMNHTINKIFLKEYVRGERGESGEEKGGGRGEGRGH